MSYGGLFFSTSRNWSTCKLVVGKFDEAKRNHCRSSWSMSDSNIQMSTDKWLHNCHNRIPIHRSNRYPSIRDRHSHGGHNRDRRIRGYIRDGRTHHVHNYRVRVLLHGYVEPLREP